MNEAVELLKRIDKTLENSARIDAVANHMVVNRILMEMHLWENTCSEDWTAKYWYDCRNQLAAYAKASGVFVMNPVVIDKNFGKE